MGFNVDLFKDKVQKKFNTYKEFCKHLNLIGYEVKEDTIKKWGQGVNTPKPNAFSYIAEALDLTIIDLFDEAPKEKEKIIKQELSQNPMHYTSLLPSTLLPPTVKKISLTNGYVGAGSSGLMEDIDVVDEIYIDINTIAKRYRNNDINGIVVVGDSMQPWVNNGDIVLYSIIDPTFPRMDGKYIISIDGNLMVKNIKFKVNGDIVISSENKAYSDDIIKSDSQEQDCFRIVGVVAGRILKG